MSRTMIWDNGQDYPCYTIYFVDVGSISYTSLTLLTQAARGNWPAGFEPDELEDIQVVKGTIVGCGEIDWFRGKALPLSVFLLEDDFVGHDYWCETEQHWKALIASLPDVVAHLKNE